MTTTAPHDRECVIIGRDVWTRGNMRPQDTWQTCVAHATRIASYIKELERQKAAMYTLKGRTALHVHIASLVSVVCAGLEAAIGDWAESRLMICGRERER